jgi:hypothetical protein
MRVRWKRGCDEITFTRPNVWFSLGTRGSGKSSFLESIGEGYLNEGNGVLDLFGSRDGEALAWLRSKWAKDRQILLLKGENVDVKCSFPVKNSESLTLADFEKYDIIISASPLYLNIDQEFYDAAKIEDVLYKRMHYKKIVYMCCREASNFYYSRLKVSDNQLYAKAQMVYLIRESRHMGVSLGLDSIRSYAIDIDIRSLSDYLILKAQGVQGLSKELKWLYQYVDSKMLRSLPPKRFVVVTKNGAIGYGVFPEIPWHKQEREDILNNLGMTVEHGEMLEMGIEKGSYKTVGDKEHAEIIRVYVEENIGMVKVAEKLGRASRTASIHIDGHNSSVARTGFCPACKRVKSSYFDKEAHKGHCDPLLQTA